MEKYTPSSSGIHDSQQEKAPQYHDVALRALSELLRHQASATVSEHVRHEFSRPSVESIVQRPTSSAGRPTGLVSRKRTRQGKYLSDVSLDDLLDNVHLTGKEASKNLGLGLTSFKRVCRFYGITSWPQNNYSPDKSTNVTYNRPEAAHTARQNSVATMTQKDIAAVFSLEISKDAAQVEEMFRSMKEFYVMSCRMRTEIGFSIFNDTILLSLMQRLRS